MAKCEIFKIPLRALCKLSWDDNAMAQKAVIRPRKCLKKSKLICDLATRHFNHFIRLIAWNIEKIINQILVAGKICFSRNILNIIGQVIYWVYFSKISTTSFNSERICSLSVFFNGIFIFTESLYFRLIEIESEVNQFPETKASCVWLKLIREKPRTATNCIYFVSNNRSKS